MQSGSEDGEAIVADSPDPRQAAEWDLVLTSATIPSQVRHNGVRWIVSVSTDDLSRAREVLEAYRGDNLPRSTPPVATLEYGPTYVGLAVAVAFVAFHALLAVYDRDQLWFWRGNASAERILRGELWRTVTALTLHGDIVHVCNNAVFFTLFASALCRAVGPGVGLWLLLLAGATGNLVDAFWRGTPHIAVGASTSIFGAVGALGGLRFLNRYRIAESRRRAWVALAATLALLAMLGAAPGSDILAHLFGLVAGVGLGIAAAIKLPHPPGRGMQWLLTVAAAALVGLCWTVAWR